MKDGTTHSVLILGGGRYEDAFDTLQALKDRDNVKITVFSNG